MKKILLTSLVILSSIILIARFGSKPVLESLGFQEKAGLKITAVPEAVVTINGLEAGQSPYEDESLKGGEYRVKITAGKAFWEGQVKLTGGTISLVNRELSPNVASSAGEVLTLEPGGGAVVTSNPNQAEVEIDGKLYGKTPLVVSDLSPGDHTFVISQSNFLKRSIRASLPPKMSLHITVDLAVSEADLGSVVTPAEKPTPKLTIMQTPTGFLRVRDKPSLSGAEVGRLSPGDVVTQLEELAGWVKIRGETGTEGYISSSYVQKTP